MSDYNNVAREPGPPIRRRIWDVFISYVREDAAIARSLAVAIEDRGFSIWLDAKLRSDEPLQAIDQALRSSGAVIVLLSGNSLSSRWHRREVDVALEVLPRDCVFPIAVGKVDINNLPAWLATRRWLHLHDQLHVEKLVNQLLPSLSSVLGDRESGSEDMDLVNDLPPRVPLVGVSSYIQELRDQRRGVTWIVGMAGMGKTALAREYVFQVRGEVDSVWWLSGLNSDSSGFMRQLRSIEELSSSNGRNSGLIVVDGFDEVSGNLNELAGRLEVLGRSHRILITTRRAGDSRLMQDGIHAVLALGPLSQATIVEYLDSISLDVQSEQRAELTRITQATNGSPVLLRLAMQLLSQQSPDELTLETSNSEVAIDRVLHLLLGQLSTEERHRLDVLSFCSGLLTLIRASQRWNISGDNVLFDRMIQWGICIEQGDRTLFAHQAVLDFLRNNTSRKALKDAIAYVTPRLPDPGDVHAQELLSSVADLTELSEIDWDTTTSANLAELLIWQASVWRAAGEPERAELLCPRALMLAADSGQILLRIRTMNLQSALAFDRGRPMEASAIERQAASIAAVELGRDHPMAIASLANLATSLRAQGDLPEAITLLRQVVEQSRVSLPTGHPDLTAALGNLAVCLREAGLFDEAMKLLREAIDAAADGRSRLRLDQVLAALLTDLGRLDEASAVLSEGLVRAGNSSDSGHGDVLMARANLAMVYAQQGRLDDALSIQSEVVDSFNVTHGPDHPSALSASVNYAMLLAVAGSSETALQLFFEVAASRDRILGSDHPDTLQSWLLAARAARDHGDHMRALEIYSNLKGDVIRVFGPDHAMSFTVREEIAQQLARTQNMSECRLVYRELLADLDRVMSPDHPMLTRVRVSASRYL